MTGTEFSDAFDTLVNSYTSNGNFGEQSSRQTPVFDEYEKSLFLTQAQEETCNVIIHRKKFLWRIF